MQCAQEMLCNMQVLAYLELKVKKPMIHLIKSKEAVALENGWSVGGRKHHTDVNHCFLHELKKESDEQEVD